MLILATFPAFRDTGALSMQNYPEAVLLLGILLAVALLSWGIAVLIDVDDDLTLGTSIQAFLNIFPITMAFGSLALALSARLRSRGAVIGITFGIVIVVILSEREEPVLRTRRRSGSKEPYAKRVTLLPPTSTCTPNHPSS